MFPVAALLMVVAKQICAPQNRCFPSHHSHASLRKKSAPHSIDVLFRIAPAYRCFSSHRPTTSLRNQTALHRIDVSSRIAPQDRCSVPHQFRASMFRPASLLHIDAKPNIASTQRYFLPDGSSNPCRKKNRSRLKISEHICLRRQQTPSTSSAHRVEERRRS